jgi:hypothetical protein
MVPDPVILPVASRVPLVCKLPLMVELPVMEAPPEFTVRPPVMEAPPAEMVRPDCPVMRPEKVGLLTTLRVREPPRETAPPPETLVPLERVMELFWRKVFVTDPAGSVSEPPVKEKPF